MGDDRHSAAMAWRTEPPNSNSVERISSSNFSSGRNRNLGVEEKTLIINEGAFLNTKKVIPVVSKGKNVLIDDGMKSPKGFKNLKLNSVSLNASTS